MTETEPSRAERRQRYQRVLSAIYHKTGDPQPVMCRSTVLRRALANSLDEDAAVATLKAALENGDVIKWRAGGCRTRYGLTASGIEELDNYHKPIFDPADESALREVIEVETKKANPDRDVVGWVNRRLATLEGESDG